MLTVNYALSVLATYSGQRGLVAGAGTLAQSSKVVLSDGTGAGQADGLFTYDTVDPLVGKLLAAGDTDTYFLSDGLLDLYGAALEFTAIKLLMVQADLANTADLVVGGGSWSGPFGDASNTLAIKPGCLFQMVCSDAVGWPVDPDNDQLPITCVNDANYSVVLIGVSSALSAPGYTLEPAIIGTPVVGVETDCTVGDWSGNPVFAYKWTRNKTVIAGATGASYTSVTADAGKALARITTASNIIGHVTVTTASVIVQASGNVIIENDFDLTSGTTGVAAAS